MLEYLDFRSPIGVEDKLCRSDKKGANRNSYECIKHYHYPGIISFCDQHFLQSIHQKVDLMVTYV